MAGSFFSGYNTACTATGVPAGNGSVDIRGTSVQETTTIVSLPGTAGTTGLYPVNPFATSSTTITASSTIRKKGWILTCAGDATQLSDIVSAIASTSTNPWKVFAGFHLSTAWSGTLQIWWRLFWTNAAMSSSTLININGSDANGYMKTGNITPGVATNFNGNKTDGGGTALQTSPNGQPYLYCELLLDVTTKGALGSNANLGDTTATISITANIPNLNYSRAPSETVGVAADTVGRVFAGARTATETVGPADDSVTRMLNATRAPTETVGSAADTVTRRFVGARAVTESVGPASDTVSRVQTLSRTITETIGPASDTVARMFNARRTITETVGPASDTVARTVAFNKLIVETVGPASDTVTRRLVVSRLITETVGPGADTVARTAHFNRLITEDLTTGGGGTTTVNPVYVFDA